jgi:hypothetical protein
MDWLLGSGMDILATIFGSIDSPYLEMMISPAMKAELTKYAIICTFLMAMIKKEQKRNLLEVHAAIKTLELHLETIEKTFEGILSQVKEFKGIFRTQNKRFEEVESTVEIIKYEVYEIKQQLKPKE